MSGTGIYVPILNTTNNEILQFNGGFLEEIKLVIGIIPCQSKRGKVKATLKMKQDWTGTCWVKVRILHLVHTFMIHNWTVNVLE
jgi:hypothetical protein